MRRDVVAQARATYNELAAQVTARRTRRAVHGRDAYLKSVDSTRFVPYRQAVDGELDAHT